ncbi:MAG: ABC transporter substrate-binding protein [Trueperaceae bacterium]
MQRLSRRRFLRNAAGTGALLATSGNLLHVLGQEQEELDLPQGGTGKLTVIHRAEYFKEVEELFRASVEAFASENSIELDISTANPEVFGDFVAKMTAAVQAGNPPDLAFHSLSITQMHSLGLLEDVTDVVDAMIAQYGDIVPASAREGAFIDDKWWAVPFISSTGAWFARKDIFEAKGIDVNTLKTWDERRDAALEASDPDNKMWGWGITINKSGDGHGVIISCLQAFGSRFVDETGLKVVFDSPETVAAVEWLNETYTSEKYRPMLPPGIESWTDSNNNEAYLAGTIGMTANAFSVYAKAKGDKNPVYENTAVLHVPQNNDGTLFEGGSSSWFTIFKGSQNVDVSKQLIQKMLEPEVFTPMAQLGGGLFLPAYKNLWNDELRAIDPNMKIIEEIVFNPVIHKGISHPADPNPATDAILGASIPSQMMANVTTGAMTAAEAVKDAHDRIVAIFEEGGIMQ